MPCGACRQLLLEYAPQAIVLTADSANPRQVTEMAMAELLPRPFVLLPPKNCS